MLRHRCLAPLNTTSLWKQAASYLSICAQNRTIYKCLIFSGGCRDMLQELMDDEDEMRDMNLSSRPGREEKRRVRERDRLEREMER